MVMTSTRSRRPPSTDWPTLPVLNFDSPFPPQPPSTAMGGPGAWPGTPVHAQTHTQTPPDQPSRPPSRQDTWKETKADRPSGLFKAGHLLKRTRTHEAPAATTSSTGPAAAQPAATSEKSSAAAPVNRDESSEDIKEALRQSQEEDRVRREEEEALQKALAASKIDSAPPRPVAPEQSLQAALEASKADTMKGKGKAPQRSESTDPDELARAIEMSKREVPPVYLDDLSDEELLQLTEFDRPRHAGMFDNVDTSSLSIISEQTEQATVASPAGGPTPMTTSPSLVDPAREAEPSYFGLWMGSDYQQPTGDIKGYLNDQPATFLPPLSEMVNLSQQRQPQAADSPTTPTQAAHKRPLPQPPGLPPRKPEESPHPQQATEQPASAETRTSPTLAHEAPALPPRASLSQDHSYRTAPDSVDGALSNEGSDFKTAMERSDTEPSSSAESSGVVSQTLGQGPSNSPATAEPEVVWPQHQSTTRPSGLPAGAHYGIANESDANIPKPSVVRFGFLGPHHDELQPTNISEPFPDVIQLTRSSDVDEYATFGLETVTFSGLTRFLSLHGDTRIEASPRDIASEKVGTGTTALAASFLRGPEGPCIRLTCHLLPPNTNVDSLPSTTTAPHSGSTSVFRRSKDAVQPQEISLPDSLTLPVKFSDIAAMLLTLRHLAFLAAAMPESKQTNGSYSALRSLGIKIAELSQAQSRGTAEDDRARTGLRSKLKSRLPSRKV